MKKILLITGYLIFFFLNKSFAQTVEVKHVTANGGEIKINNNFASQCVVGQLIVGEFSAGALSGSIGYLDSGDSLYDRISSTVYAPEISIYPNPNSGSFIVSLIPTEPSKASILLINDLGQVVSIRQIVLNYGSNKFDYTNVSPGIYFVTVVVENKKGVTEKVVVQ